jgi:NAD(P)-dependent dehydrogenase (short-subunit alcohol dehydrogenase family)
VSPRVVLVTGGTRGIGRGIVRAFKATGTTVATCGRKPPEQDESDLFVAGDVRQWDDVDRIVSTVVERFGRLDVVVNNAGGAPPVAAADAKPSFHEKIVALNLTAPLHVAQRAYAVMRAQDTGGVIVNIASVAAHRPSPQVAAYAAAKAGLVSLTKTLAVEWGPKVRVVCVSPGMIWTRPDHAPGAPPRGGADAFYADRADRITAAIPAGRFGTPDEIGAACVFLASDGAAYVSGAELVIDGGGERPAWLTAKEQA